MKAERLFLVFKKNDYFYRFCNHKKMQCEQIFSKNNIIFMIASLMKKIGLPIPSLCYGSWKNRIKAYEKIVITDYAYVPGIVKYVKRNNPNCILCFYYMNDIDLESKMYAFLEIHAIKRIFLNNVYTYSKSDADKYGIIYKHTMYKEAPNYRKQNDYDIDIVYLGSDKSRGKSIERIYILLNKFLKLDFKILKNTGTLGIKKAVDYNIYLNNVWRSKAILDIVNTPKKAVSLRELEALFYDKKLITNNVQLKELEIYNGIKDNVYFIDCDNINVNEIINFLGRPFACCETKSLRTFLRFEQWLDLF